MEMSRSLFAPVKAGSQSRLLYSGLAATRIMDLAVHRLQTMDLIR